MPARRRAATCLALLFLFLPWAVAAQALAPAGGLPNAAPGAAPAPLLRMRAGTFDPAAGLPNVPSGLLVPSAPNAPGSVDSAGNVHFILQYAGAVTPRLVGWLAGRGITYERYLPDGGLIASAAPGRVPESPAAVGARALLALSPAFKVTPDLWQTALAPPDADILLTVLVFDTPGAGARLAALSTVIAFDGRMATVSAPAPSVLAVALLGDVEWVEPYQPPQLLLDQATETMGARQATDGPFTADGRSLWSYNASNDSFEGITGKGVIVNIADTGIDQTHPDFEGRIVASFGAAPLYPNATCDCYGFPHGTHVAGIVAGNGSWRPEDENRTDGKYAGVAPEAGLIAQIIFGNPRTTSQLSAEVAAAGAYINSNSWGGSSGASYTSTAQAYDDLVRDANGRDAGSPQMVYVFAAGNSGPGVSTTDSPGTAKNVITVGATGDGHGSSPNVVVGFSSRGPTSDGRLKPDVVAPGDGVYSARAQSAGCGGGEGGCSYWPLSGTSMSTPAVSGAAALVTEWYRLTHGVLPSPAMVKAALIAGAAPLPGYTWPDNNQGWGRVNVSSTVNEGSTFRHIMFDESTAVSTTGRTNVTHRVFAGSDQELKVVLVWSDVPGTTSSSKALINDLDLEVQGPDGEVLLGNSIQGGYSVVGTAHDTGNNTEVVRIRAPVRGIYNITVRAVTVPSGDQKFAVFAQGNITDDWVTVSPRPAELLPPSPREADPLTVVVPVENTGTRISQPMDVTATLSGPEGDETQTIRLLAIIQGDDLPAVFHFAPQRGTHTLRVTVDPGGESGDLLPSDNTRTDTFFVRGFEVGIEVLNAPRNVTPLGSTPFVLRVINLGNVRDQVAVSATGPTGWTFALNFSSSFVDPGGAALVSGVVTAPERALAGVDAHFNITASSGGNASRKDSITLTVPVDPFVSLRVAPDAYSATTNPGGTVSFSFLLQNAGNVQVSVSLDVGIDAGAPPGWGAQAFPSNLTVPPYSNASGRVDVVAPPGALASEVRTITVRPFSPEFPSVSPVALQVFVARVRSFEVDMNHSQAVMNSGGKATMEGTIHNRGNAREYYSVLLEPDAGGVEGLLWSASPVSVAVDPGAAASFGIEVWSLPGGPAGTGTAVLRVSAEGAEDSVTGLGAQILERHALSISSPARIAIPQGTAYSAGVSVTNGGNVPETVLLQVASAGAGGVSFEGLTSTFTIAPGETQLVKARVVADSAAAPGVVTFHLTATGQAAGAEASADIDVDVQPAASAATSFLPGVGPAALVYAVIFSAALASGGRRRR